MAYQPLSPPTQATLSRSQLPSSEVQPTSLTPPQSSAAAAAKTLDRESAIAALRTSCELQIEYLTVLTDSVMLAVTQVQSESILQLASAQNNGKRATVSEAFIDVALSLVGAGVGSLIEKNAEEFFQDLASGILSTNTAFKVLPLSANGKAMSGDAIDQALAAIASTRQTKVSGGAWTIYSANTRKIITAGTDKIAKSLGEAASSQIEKAAPKEAPKAVGTDLPQTAILRVVQGYVSAHRVAVRTECINLEAFIRSQHSMTKNQLSTLVGSFAIAPPPQGFESLRSDFAMQIEGLLWGRLYKLTSQETAYDNVVTGVLQGGSLSNVPDAITHYWWQRFGPKVAPGITDPYAQTMTIFRWMVQLDRAFDQQVQEINAPGPGIISFDPQPWPPQ
jgi:hypothetical protein